MKVEVEITDTYFDSFAMLGTTVQKRINRLKEKLSNSLESPGIHKEPLGNDLVSLRGSQSIRVIAQEGENKIILLYVGQHDDAYEWAEKRKKRDDLTQRFYRSVSVELSDPETPLIADEKTQDTHPFTKELLEKLTRSGTPEYLIRSFESCRDEDSFMTCVETMPEADGNRILASYLGEDTPRHDASENKRPATVVESDLPIRPSSPPIVTLKKPVLDVDGVGQKGVVDEILQSRKIETTYESTRLLFKRGVIEALEPTQSFRVIVKNVGIYEMTQSDFYRVFANIPQTRSWQEYGIYHSSAPPQKSEQFRVKE